MPQFDKTIKKTREKTRKKGDFIIHLTQEKLKDHLIIKRKSSTTAIEIFRNNRRRKEKKNQKKGIRIEVKKPTRLNLNKNNPKVGGKTSNILKKRQNRKN